ncbi:MAG: aldehyde ferredoxin oxidoreductase family protein [Haloferacaceae archaeon]
MNHATGPLLTIDVGSRSTETEDIDEIHEQYLGGRGVGTKVAYEHVPFDADPLGPDNSVVFATGPMQYSNMSFTGRMSATGLSPHTNGLLSSNAGGFLSRNFTGAGYGAVEITGASDELLAVHVSDEGVEFEAVPDLEGATVDEVTDYMETNHELGEDAIACIGPAGENLVKFAAIVTTEHRAFARGGLGAVLGSKNVKAVTFSGDSGPQVQMPEGAMDVHREAATADHPMKETGTPTVTSYANYREALPTRYFSERQFYGVDGIDGDAVGEKKYQKGTCSQCAFACKLPTKDEETGLVTEGPEFETVMAFGSNAGVDDVVSIMKSNDLCDNLGLDTISAGDVVSAYLASKDEFGNDELIHETIEKIAHREGIGDTLAEGIARFHEELDVENWTAKNLEFPAHDGRKLNGQGLAFATSNRGADHMYGEVYPFEYPLVDKDRAYDPEGLEGKPQLVAERENHNALLDCGVVCKFSRDFMTPERMEKLFDADYDDLLAVGGRVVEHERAFNNRRGFDRDDDTVPYEDQIDGFQDALSEYYEIRGWNDDGTVPQDTLDAAPADD